MSERPTVYLTRDIPQAGRDALEDHCEVVVWPDAVEPSHETLIERVADLEADGLFCTVADTVDATVMDASESLRAIGTMSVGYDHIDLEAARAREITVGHTPGVLAETTADLGWALLMAGARRTVEAHTRVRDGDWESWGPTVLLGRDIHEATLGVVGLGRIGTEFAKRAAGFDMDVVYSHTSPNEAAERELAEYGIDATYCSLEDVLERSDFVSLHVPLLEDTHHLLGEDELRRMDDEAILVNTARGEIVDTDALVQALESGWIRHAALDVSNPEPLPADHQLLDHAPESLTISPHIGSASMATRSEMAVMTAENILAGLRGSELPHSAFDDADLS
ncbi:D-glycerate dehydrogenase [Salinadaptatus halalkaliphilus]|uniref:D-glycerate dehydrogenase n=1 Tax=Salinadaptatus halalkaliphilus TaxID=2419781 RepID=A0A4S3TIW3_9EURY|nr:D-glycerate dehydrogenase [Salinadaptatus halalkaliphilus]THE63979.1 D-glycerate dehydrogenase [Salinadaptatus halalkaliphilus]